MEETTSSVELIKQQMLEVERAKQEAQNTQQDLEKIRQEIAASTK